MQIPFLPPGNDLNNREVSAAVWIVAVVAVVLATKGGRQFAVALARDFANRFLLLWMATFLGWVVLTATLGWRIGLWSGDLVKDTAVWFLTFALVRLFRINNLQKEPDLFRHMVVDSVGVSAFVEFLTNLYVFPLIGELALVPLATFLGLVAVVPSDRKNLATKRLANVLLAVIGLAIVVFSIWQIAANLVRIDVSDQVRVVALPVWLGIAALPYLYVMSLLVGYEAAFLRVAFATPGRRIKNRSRIALVSVLQLRARAVAGFGGRWIGQLAEAATLKEARSVVRDYLMKFGQSSAN